MATFMHKVALVTGASRGMGQVIAEELSAKGASAVLNYVHTKEFADGIVPRIQQQGGQAARFTGRYQ